MATPLPDPFPEGVSQGFLERVSVNRLESIWLASSLDTPSPTPSQDFCFYYFLVAVLTMLSDFFLAEFTYPCIGGLSTP